MEQMQAAAPKSIFYDNIMIDLETLGTHADSVILSIGAVKFTTDGAIQDAAFYAVVDMKGQSKRNINTDTLVWWMQQSPEAQKVFSSTNKTNLYEALGALEEWVGPKYDGCVWSNGADFDIPILSHAYRDELGSSPPWKFYKHRCFRTLKELYKNVPKPALNGTTHNALHDAIHQVNHLHAIYEEMRNPAPKKGFAASK
jgi:DNA polymerase III epsilon subunit-like protein